MFTDKIYCFGDGYAHGHIWPEWPQILQALLPQYEVKLVSGIGAGPEYLVTEFSKLLPVDGMVIFQWPCEHRFDKIIQDGHWLDIANNDPVYHFNIVKNESQTWWLSSASNAPEIREYHQKFIQSEQAKIRLTVYQTLVREILEKTKIKYIFTSNFEQDIASKKNAHIRGNEIQPSPLSHFYFLTEKIMPALGLTSNNTTALEQLLQAQKWIAYDPDRSEIWNNIKLQLVNAADK
jgi:hypothetical protein